VRKLVIWFDDGATGVDVDEVAFWEADEQRFDASGRPNARGRTIVREVEATLRSGASVSLRLYPDDWPRWLEAFAT
jgi:hypothetical protein